VPSTIPAMVRGRLSTFLDFPVFRLYRTNRTMLCASLNAQANPPITTRAVKLVLPPPTNGTFKPVNTATTKKTVMLTSTIENILFERVVAKLTPIYYIPHLLIVQVRYMC